MGSGARTLETLSGTLRMGRSWGEHRRNGVKISELFSELSACNLNKAEKCLMKGLFISSAHPGGLSL